MVSERGRRFVALFDRHRAELLRLVTSDAETAGTMARLLEEFRPALLFLLYRDVNGVDLSLDAGRIGRVIEAARGLQPRASPELARALQDLIAEVAHLEERSFSEAYLQFVTFP